MKRSSKAILTLAILMLSIAAALAQSPSGKVLTKHIESEILDTTMSYNIYLPPDYKANDQNYPLFFLLHGYVGDHTDWVKRGKVDKTMDRLLARDAAKPYVIVMPDAHNSWYVDSDANESWGNYETAIIKELRTHIEQHYRIDRSPGSRYIAGLSMGGYGALHLAFKYPELFRAAASMSGAFMPEFPEGYDILEGTFGRPPSRKKYQKENPFMLASADSSVQMPVYITCGDDDKRLFHYSVAMYDTLQNKGYPSELRITDGAHTWKVWSREIEKVMEFFNQN